MLLFAASYMKINLKRQKQAAENEEGAVGAVDPFYQPLTAEVAPAEVAHIRQKMPGAPSDSRAQPLNGARMSV